jgi:hypothetical protein
VSVSMTWLVETIEVRCRYQRCGNASRQRPCCSRDMVGFQKSCESYGIGTCEVNRKRVHNLVFGSENMHAFSTNKKYPF